MSYIVGDFFMCMAFSVTNMKNLQIHHNCSLQLNNNISPHYVTSNSK
jgi:hypothetical protein